MFLTMLLLLPQIIAGQDTPVVPPLLIKDLGWDAKELGSVSDDRKLAYFNDLRGNSIILSLSDGKVLFRDALILVKKQDGTLSLQPREDYGKSPLGKAVAGRVHSYLALPGARALCVITDESVPYTLLMEAHLSGAKVAGRLIAKVRARNASGWSYAASGRGEIVISENWGRQQKVFLAKFRYGSAGASLTSVGQLTTVTEGNLLAVDPVRKRALIRDFNNPNLQDPAYREIALSRSRSARKLFKPYPDTAATAFSYFQGKLFSWNMPPSAPELQSEKSGRWGAATGVRPVALAADRKSTLALTGNGKFAFR